MKRLTMAKKMERNESMLQSDIATIFSGDANNGLQIAHNSGRVSTSINIDKFSAYQRNAPEPTSNTPFRQDPDFVDRGDLLTSLLTSCSTPAARIALVGLGGVGKSQLAIEFSYRIRGKDSQTWVFWVHGGSRARFEEGYKAIADMVKLPERSDPKTDILLLVYSWLSSMESGKWVIILDNADQSSVFFNGASTPSGIGDDGATLGLQRPLSTFLPQSQYGAILITTRDKDTAFRLTGRYPDIFEVSPMSEDEALSLLQKKLGNRYEDEAGAKLVTRLENMPLAITQAAAYICQRLPRCSISKYANDLHKSGESASRLLSHDSGDLRRDWEASHSIIVTWQISFDHIRETRASAADLLALMSFFDRQGIPEYLLQGRKRRNGINSTHDQDDNEVGGGDEASSSDSFEDDVTVLQRYSLISTERERDSFQMHRLVQLSTRRWLEEQGQLETWRQVFVSRMSGAFPIIQYENWPTMGYNNWATCQELYPHVEAMLAHEPANVTLLKQWSITIRNSGCYAFAKGSYKEAEKLLVLSWKPWGSIGKPPGFMPTVHVLILALCYQGEYERLEEILRAAILRCQQWPNKKDFTELRLKDNLGLILIKKRNDNEAQELVERGLEVLKDRGKLKKAEEMSQRALLNCEIIPEKKDPLPLDSDPFSVLLGQEQTLKFFQQESERLEKKLGKEHRETLSCRRGIAEILSAQRKYDEAERIERQVLDLRERALGREDPDTLSSLHDLVRRLREQGRLTEAEETSVRTLEARERVLGEEHPDTLRTRHDLGMILYLLGQYNKAEEVSRRALERRVKVLGREHSETLMSACCWACSMRMLRRDGEDDVLLQRVCTDFEKAYGLHNSLAKVIRLHSDNL